MNEFKNQFSHVYIKSDNLMMCHLNQVRKFISNAIFRRKFMKNLLLKMMKSRHLSQIFKYLYFGIFLIGVYSIIKHLTSTNHLTEYSTIDCNNENDEFKLSHVIIPFHVEQTEIVIETVKKWSKYKPCINVDPRMKSKMPQILFYLGYSDNKLDLNQIKSKLDEIRPQLTCFSNSDRIDLVDFRIQPEFDNRIFGANAMFEHLLMRNHSLFRTAKFVFYIEADARPIKSNWLYAIEREIGWNRFWLRGCSYTGDNAIDIHHTHDLMYAYHWNGNALYNLNDDGFRSFYFNTLKPYSLNTQHPYDWFFIRYILDEANWRMSTKILHRFQYTDFIVNTYGLLDKKYTLDEFKRIYPDTYFSHRFIPEDY